MSLFSLPLTMSGGTFTPSFGSSYAAKMGDFDQQMKAGENQLNFGISGNALAIGAIAVGLGAIAFFYFRKR